MATLDSFHWFTRLRLRLYVPVTVALFRLRAPSWLVNLPGQVAFPVRSLNEYLGSFTL